MKSSVVSLAVLLSLTLFTVLAPRSQADASPGPSQDELEQRVATLAAKVTQLENENQMLTKRLDEIARYLAAQAQSGKALAGRLDESESLGFTKGMNYESREVLLAGFRDFIASQQTGLPRAKPAPEEEQETARGRR